MHLDARHRWDISLYFNHDDIKRQLISSSTCTRVQMSNCKNFTINIEHLALLYGADLTEGGGEGREEGEWRFAWTTVVRRSPRTFRQSPPSHRSACISVSRSPLADPAGSTKMSSGGVVHILNTDDLKTKLKDAGNKLVVIDFFAVWCGPCKMIGPMVEELAKELKEVIFLKVDVDECEDVAAEYEISSMPTFVFIKNSEVLEKFSGANFEKLKSTVQKHNN